MKNKLLAKLTISDLFNIDDPVFDRRDIKHSRHSNEGIQNIPPLPERRADITTPAPQGRNIEFMIILDQLC